MSESSATPLRGFAATLLLSAAASAQDLSVGQAAAGATGDPVAPEDVRVALGARREGLLYDEVEGTHWVRGAAYKASFGIDGAAIVPFFGSDAPRNYPLTLRASATLGGEPIGGSADGPAARVSRSDATAELDHGGFVEQYLLAPRSLEQRFVFDGIAGEGELVVRLELESELVATDLGSTLRFHNELGSIEYGEAFAIDASGDRIALDSRLVDGAIELAVPADFVAAADLPLVIDPLVTFVPLATTNLLEIDPDVSYDVTTDRWCGTWTSVFSQSDHDVLARLVEGNGTPLPVLAIDITGTTWTRPRIANHNKSNKFLVVAAAVPPGGAAEIRGRTLLATTSLVIDPFTISPLDGAYRNWPDVGGSNDPVGGGFFCVVWQRPASLTNCNIEGRMVRDDELVLSNVIQFENGPDFHWMPSISSSSGTNYVNSPKVWTVTWQHRITGTTSNDVYGAQVDWDGTLRHPMFPISLAPTDDTSPMVSTILEPSASSGPERSYMVVFQRRLLNDHDLVGVVMQGATVLETRNLSSVFEGTWAHLDQTNPTIDSDGYGFLVGYDERPVPDAVDSDVRISGYSLAGGTLQPCAVHEALASTAVTETDLSLCSQATSGGPQRRFAGVWPSWSAAGAFDTQLALWDLCIGGSVHSVCSGDGTGGACPCGNAGAAGRGCANSANAAGALLSWTGDASVSADTLTLHANGMPSTASCLFFQTASLANGGLGQPFGDGLRCAVGPAIRLGLFSASGGAASYPTPGGLPIHLRGLVPGFGGTRYYQAWYRDPASFCTTTTFNVTNALEVVWAP